MKTRTLRIRNVCLLTGRHPLGEHRIEMQPELIPAKRFGLILLWDPRRHPFLKLSPIINKSPMAAGLEGYRQVFEQLALPETMRQPPRTLAWSGVLERGDWLNVTGELDTNDVSLFETARSLTGDFADPDAFLLYPITGILVAGSATEQLEIELVLVPPDVERARASRRKWTGYLVPPYEGYVGLDLGNHNSTIAAISLRSSEEARILKEPANGEESAALDADARPISSALCYRSVVDGKFDDRLDSIGFLVGRLADNRAQKSMDGVELAAKRLAASPYYDTAKEYSIPSLNSRNLAGPADQTDVSVPRRLAAELLSCQLLQLFREATRTVPTRLAISYPTTFSERELKQLQEVVHRGWLRMQTRPQNEEALRPLRRRSNGAARLAPDKEGILLMLDEASAAAFFFLFDRILKADGQLSRFRYLFPNGLNLLLFDCGGGTTDVALVRALVRPANPRKLILTVRGRVGSRRFGGDFITECVHRLVKAKLASELSTLLDEKPLPRFPHGGTPEVIAAYLQRHAQAVDRLVPTQFDRGPHGSGLTHAAVERQTRSFALWRLAETLKRKVAESGDKPAGITAILLEELSIPGLTEEKRDSLGKITVSRAEVDGMIKGRLDELVGVCNSLIQKKLVEKSHTGLDEEFPDPEDVHWVVAAGAACRYPLIPETLRTKLQVPFLNSADEEFRQSRMTIDDANLKHAVAKGLAKVLLILDTKDIELEFDSDLSRRLPFEVVYRDRMGLRRVLFRENAHFDSLTESKTLVPDVRLDSPETAPDAAPDEDEDRAPGHHVILYRRFAGETQDTAYLKYYFRDGVEGELTVKYDPDVGYARGGASPFVMVNEQTQEQGECEDLSPEESYLHPVQRGDL